MQLTNNTILITGGSSGIGYALALAFAGAGNRVIITGRNRNNLERVHSQHPDIEIAQADLRDPNTYQNLAARYPEVNVLINNAGVQFNYELTDATISAEQITTEINTNFTGHVLLTQAFLPVLLRHPQSAIINVTSTLGIVPKQNAAIYCATKAAMHSFSQTLRWQLEKTPVKVFEVLPPLVDTPMTAGRNSTKATPEDVAQEVVNGFASDRFEMWIGKTRGLRVIHRISPATAQRIMRLS